MTILDAQTDSIIVVEKHQAQMIGSEGTTEISGTATKVQNSPKESPNILWCNRSSTNLFGLDIVGPTNEEESGQLAQNQLILPQFMPIYQNDFDEKHSETRQRKKDRLRKLINESVWQGSARQTELMSLKDIVQKRPDMEDSELRIEQYIRLANSVENVGDQKVLDTDKTVIVSRMHIKFKELECQLITFTDVSIYQQLKDQEERSEKLNSLNTSVHHEMVCPLRINVRIAEELLQLVEDMKIKRMA